MIKPGITHWRYVVPYMVSHDMIKPSITYWRYVVMVSHDMIKPGITHWRYVVPYMVSHGYRYDQAWYDSLALCGDGLLRVPI